jgi:acyl-CoA reductase-like NAD-dependent aldehyde dehydrogenase
MDKCWRSISTSSQILKWRAAGTMKKVGMELDGNAPFIIFADTNLTSPSMVLLRLEFLFAGQTCVVRSHFLLQITRPLHKPCFSLTPL